MFRHSKHLRRTVRRKLIEAVTRKLDFALTAKTPDYLTTFAPQVAALRKLAQLDRAGLIERVAYTWFNRFAALRFMDARGWHPFRARVLTPASASETQPELLKLMRSGALPEDLKSHTDPKRLNDLLDGRIPSADAQGEVYRHLVLAVCRFYHVLLPNIFEKLDDETELLLPDDLLSEQSVIHGFRTEITDEDCSEVEILGWLYQFYISERKDAGHGAQERRAQRGHSRRHPALHSALDRPLPRRKLPRPALAAESPRLPAARAHALLHRGRTRDRLPQDHQTRGNPPVRSRGRQRAHAHLRLRSAHPHLRGGRLRA